VLLAFKRYNHIDGIFGSPWVGLDNFRFLFVSGAMVGITLKTILYNIAFISVDIVLQVSFAIILSQLASKAFKRIVQSILFFPYLVSFVIFGAIVFNIFQYNYGSLNTLLKALGVQPVDIYSMPQAWPFIIVVSHLWKWTGYGTVIYLASIYNIDPELYEAAQIDGAGIIQQIFQITIPLLRPTISILLLLSVGRILRGQFEMFYQLVGDNGLLFSTTDIIDTYVFRALTRTFDIGLGSAVSFFQSTFGFIVVLLTNKAVKAIDPEYGLF
jgi:putative aldouronate transport system permease protein